MINTVRKAKTKQKLRLAVCSSFRRLFLSENDRVVTIVYYEATFNGNILILYYSYCVTSVPLWVPKDELLIIAADLVEG